jgi:hypothetical protein
VDYPFIHGSALARRLRHPHLVRAGRGYVEHLGSRQRRYFLELREVLDFVAAVSELPFRAALGEPGDEEPRT